VSIPSSLLSMAIFKPFKSNVLEVNGVQTGTSAGASTSAGIIYTIPALILMKIWKDMQYIPTTVIAILGGLLGVLFTIPLRRALIIDNPLTFPEGIATAEVLKFGMKRTNETTSLLIVAIIGILIGFLSKLLTSG